MLYEVITLTPFLALSQEYGRFDFHASSGIQINTDDKDRSRIRYSGGVAVQLIEQLALLVDVIGSSSLQTVQLSRTVKDSITRITSYNVCYTKLLRSLSFSDSTILSTSFRPRSTGSISSLDDFVS